MDELMKLVEAYGEACADAMSLSERGTENEEQEAEKRAAETLTKIRAMVARIAINTLRGAADDFSRGSATSVPRARLRELAGAIEADADIREIIAGVSQ